MYTLAHTSLRIDLLNSGGKLAQDKIITLVYHWGLSLFRGNNH
jgi:hypothetical protein